ncbi:hypothetical protein RB195_015634 [Necator americanus]|uniref:Carboxylesterase type B domain-containing protein n=1 Tax=Necator americanus TaxID=51031 RepID=A0ABR1E860_NECAM
MVADAPPKVSIVGLTNKEAAFFTIVGLGSFLHGFGVNPADYPKWNREKLISELKKFIQSVYVGDHQEEVIREVIAYYVDREEEQRYEFYLDRYTEFLSDVLFNVAAVDGILARRAAGWTMYAYSFEYYNDRMYDKNVPIRMRGSPHGGEAPYTNGVSFSKLTDFNDEERLVADVLRQSFIEFVKTGAPNNSHEVWLDVGTEGSLRYLKIAPAPQMTQGFHNGSASFWHKVREYGFDVIQQLPATNSTLGAKKGI